MRSLSLKSATRVHVTNPLLMEIVVEWNAPHDLNRAAREDLLWSRCAM